MEILLGLGVVVLAVAGLSAGAVAMGRAGSNAEIRKRQAASGLTPEQAKTLKEAGRELRDARRMIYELGDTDVRDAAKEAIDKAEKLVAAIKQQPEEIRRANQFFSYYVPTIGVVLKKYRALESSGTMEDDKLTEKTKTYLADMCKAFDLQYDNLFKDEALDLHVEVEAMQMALKRDGLS